MGLDVLGRQTSEEVERLYIDVLAARPGATVTFRFGAADELEEIGKGAHLILPDGSSEIVLAEDADDGVVGHELCHALFVRRGFPQLSVLPNVGRSVRKLGFVANLCHHAALFPELERRGIDDTSHFGEMAERVSEWNLAVEPPVTSDGGMNNVWVVSELMVSWSKESSGALEHVRERFPETWSTSRRLSDLALRATNGWPQTCRESIVLMLDFYGGKVRAEYPNTLMPLQCFIVPLIISSQRLARLANQILDVDTTPNNPNLVSVTSRKDRSVIGHIPRLVPVDSATLRSIRDDRNLSTREFLLKYQIAFHELTAQSEAQS